METDGLEHQPKTPQKRGIAIAAAQNAAQSLQNQADEAGEIWRAMTPAQRVEWLEIGRGLASKVVAK